MNIFEPLKLLLYPALLLLSSLMLQACSIGGELLKEADSFRGMAQDEVIIVGSIELRPKLSKDEQKLSPDGVWDVLGYGDMNKNRCMIQFNSSPVADDYKLLINPELNKTFFFRVSRDKKYIVEGSILTEFSRYGNTGRIWLPMHFKVDIKPNDKAVYIGKIIYTRDDFNSITDIKLKDDYKKANRLFRKKFGKKYKLRKSLIQKI